MKVTKFIAVSMLILFVPVTIASVMISSYRAMEVTLNAKEITNDRRGNN